jgi:O-antigen/teichoic acid export membrane protein
MIALSIISMVGFPGVLLAFLPRAGVSAIALIVRAYAVAMSVGFLAGFAFASVAPHVTSVFEPLDGAATAVGFGACVAAFAVFGLQDDALVGLRLARWVPIENALFGLAKLVLLLALGGGVGAVGILVSWIVPVACALVIVSGMLFTRLRRHPVDRLPDLDGLRGLMVADGVSHAFGQLSTTFLPVLIAARLGAESGGAFAIAWLLATAFDLVARNMGLSLTVEGAHEEKLLGHMLSDLRVRVIAGMCGVAACGMVVGPHLLSLFGESYASSASGVLRLLLLGSVAHAITVLAMSAARARRQPMRILRLEGALAALVPTSAWMLAGTMGLTGVGIAWVLSQVVVAVGALATEPRGAA